MSKVSIILPSRGDDYQVQPGVTVLQRMIDDIYEKATGDFEVLVDMDGPPFQLLKPRPGLQVIYEQQSVGLKPCVNRMAEMATGKFLYKSDAHCMVSLGFDEILQKTMELNWLVTPRMGVLNAEEWRWQDERFYDYFYLDCPLTDPNGYRFKAGGHWVERTKERLKVGPLDETMVMHGSGWFVSRDFFLNKLGGMSSVGYGNMFMEPAELGLKTWLGPWGGQVMVNKDVSYAHMHKGKERPRGYGISMREIKRSYDWTANYWMRNAWPERAHDMAWLIDRFWEIPTWPPDWLERQAEYERTHVWTGADVPEQFTSQTMGSGWRAPNPNETLDKLHALLGIDVKRYSPNRPTEFRLSRHGGLTKLWHNLGYTTGAEIGVEQGRFSAEICRDNPGVKLFCIDPWLAYSRYFDTMEQETLDRFYVDAKERLNVYPNATIIRKTSMEAVEDFADGSLDFVFIDGNHDLEYVIADIAAWSRKVRSGGMVSGHDYKKDAKNGRIPFHVRQATNAFVDAYHIKPWFVIRGDKSASWFWVKNS